MHGYAEHAAAGPTFVHAANAASPANASISTMPRENELFRTGDATGKVVFTKSAG